MKSRVARAPGFPELAVRRRARLGPAAVFPAVSDYGVTLFGAGAGPDPDDPLDALRLVPPVFVPRRLAKLTELAREPGHADVSLSTRIGGFAAPVPWYVSAFGSTRVASTDLGERVAAQAGRLGVPMVIGENVVPVNGYRSASGPSTTLLRRLTAYADHVADSTGGVVVQQSTEDADAEVWNLVYSAPEALGLLRTGRLAFELKVGQGAKPGLGGMTVLEPERAAALADRYPLDPALDAVGRTLRCGTPGTFTDEILRQQIRLMRNNFPGARVWVKLPPGRDVAVAAAVAWAAGADAVTVDGAEAGTGWAPTVFLDQVGLPLGECLRRIGRPTGCLLASGRMWEGGRTAKALALGATAVGLGRATLVAVDEDQTDGLVRLVSAAALELRLLTSALGKYDVAELAPDDLWAPATADLAADAHPTRTGTTMRMREHTLAELRAALAGANYDGVERCAKRLDAVLGGASTVADRTVLVAYGGGKDSAYMLAVVRAVHLLMFEWYGETFNLRVVTNRHAGMPYEVMANVDRSYRALRLYDDPACQLLLVDGNVVSAFDVDAPQRAEVVAANRIDILMTGHRTAGDGRPTFCNSCNLSVANSFGLAAAYDGGVDVIVTGDSPTEQRSYLAWIRRLARRAGQPVHEAGQGFGGLLGTIDGLGQAYVEQIHGEDAKAEVALRRVAFDVPRGLVFFSIYEDTAYASGDHWDVLTGLLGFRFDEAAFNFTESDCGNPALMAHLRGLRCEHVYGRSYADGVDEYVRFAVGLMRRKEFPDVLVEEVRARYRGPDGVRRMRRNAARYAEETFGLTEEQLVCLVHAPFVGEGARLDEYLDRERPDLAARREEVRALLGGAAPTAETRVLAERLTALSGMTIDQLATLYRAPAGGRGLIDLILDGDPHASLISTRHAPDGPEVIERISGR